MKRSVYSLVTWLCAALAAISAIGWAAPGIRTGASGKPDLLVVGQSIKPRVTAAPRDLATLKVNTLSNQDKAKLFATAGFAVPNGIITKAKFTPSQPIIAKQGSINVWRATCWNPGSPTDNSYAGYVEFLDEKGKIELGFIPFVANKPVLVVFNIRTHGVDTAFDLWAGGQNQKLTLKSGSQNIACVVTPTTTDMQWVMLQCTSGVEWQFESVEVIVQQ